MKWVRSCSSWSHHCISLSLSDRSYLICMLLDFHILLPSTSWCKWIKNHINLPNQFSLSYYNIYVLLSRFPHTTQDPVSGLWWCNTHISFWTGSECQDQQKLLAWLAFVQCDKLGKRQLNLRSDGSGNHVVIFSRSSYDLLWPRISCIEHLGQNQLSFSWVRKQTSHSFNLLTLPVSRDITFLSTFV